MFSSCIYKLNLTYPGRLLELLLLDLQDEKNFEPNFVQLCPEKLYFDISIKNKVGFRNLIKCSISI